eukprot:TRINITY_DN2232_c0_g4_i4.p1 TRINITY_DN2232_c0_g4~~TRINITY_DN2232_c0_g4_i4.p1  ORF type:complete len:518 (+),score=106.42 TRINITY_DN2232_c0_g4_i4:281-1834(+)
MYSLIWFALKVCIALVVFAVLYNLVLRELYGFWFYWRQGIKVDYYRFYVGIVHKMRVESLKKYGDFIGEFKKVAAENPDKKVYLTHATGRPVLFIWDPVMLKEMLQDKVRSFVKSKNSVEMFSNLASESVLLLEGDKWKRQRRVFSSLFTFDNLKQFIPTMATTIKRILNNLKTKDQIKLIETTSLITGDVFFETFLGEEISKHKYKNEPVSVAFSKMLAKMGGRQKFQFHIRFFGNFMSKLGLTEIDREINQDKAFMNEFARHFIEARRKEIEERQSSHTPERSKDIIETIILHNEKNKDKPSEIISDNEIIHNFLTFILAGTDTTARLLTMALYWLTKNEAAKKKVIEEIERLYPRSIDLGEISYESLGEAVYLQAVLKEVLRLTPPASAAFARRAVETVDICGIKILKGTTVSFQLGVSSTNPKYFKNPYDFIPERWMSDETKNLPPFVYLPFLAGERNCIGQHFSNIEAKLVLIEFLRTFNFELENPNYKLVMVFRGVYEPKDPIILKIHPKA